MSYAYPSPRTDTAQDLLRVVTRAYELEVERAGTVLPAKGDAARRWLAAPFRALGVCVAWIMEALPADWAMAIHDGAYARLAGRAYPFDPASPVLVRARALAARVEAETGAAPALLAVISHPPAMGELAHLNFALGRHALGALRVLRGCSCRPRQVVATDPFALDTASVTEEGLYAGYMGTYHLGIDRMALGRAGAWRFMTPRALWFSMPFRLLRALAEGGEVGIILAGGVPATGRIFYGVREWARRARAASPLKGAPDEVSRALRATESFLRFERALSSTLHLPRSSWRLVEIWLMSAAAGLLPDETLEAAASTVLGCLSVPPDLRPPLLAELLRESSRETPTRRRLFRLIAGRVARRRPVVFLPVVHSVDPLGVHVREGCSWELVSRGRVRVRRADAPDAAVEMDSGDFAERFVGENFA